MTLEPGTDRARFVVANTGGLPVRFVLEPWGEIETLEAGTDGKFELCGAEPIELRIEVDEEGVTVRVEGGWDCGETGPMITVRSDRPLQAEVNDA